MGKFSEVDDMVHLSLTFRRIILVPLSLNFNEDSFVMDTQPYVRIEFGKYQRYAYFFPFTRGQLDSLCISVNVPWNSAVDMASTSSRLQKMILRRLRPEFLEDSFMMGPQRHMRLQLLVIKLPVFRTLETAHDRLAHRWHWDFGIPHVTHASHTSLSLQRMIL
ncbi:hypothetical protein Tsp_10455, partial [Trichinella spiralis]|uniref:hypothetical protein n=1 Tax=Trichinella spiralis TaxID=6334 RepID=UPI0001EFEE71